jgi:hypothetical protein
MVARERETRNWAMLRITSMPVREILHAKIAALTHLLLWPTAAVLALEFVAVLLAGLALIAGLLIAGSSAPDWSPVLDALGVNYLILGSLPLFGLYIVAATLISLIYNCAVGLLTSTMTRTTASAVILSFVVHFGLLMLVFVPAQQVISIALQLIGGGLTTGAPPSFAIFVLGPIISFLLPVVLQIAVGGLAYAVAVNQANKIEE